MSELQHHGIAGQKWGIRNGPPYPLDRKSTGEKKRAVDNLLNDLNSKWDYGVLHKGEHITDISNFDFGKNYKTTPVETLEKEKCGVCWDFVNYQHWKLKQNGIDDKSYMFVMEKPDGGIVTHTFTTYELNGKNYWLESAMWPKRGNHEIKDVKDVIPEIQDNYQIHDAPYSLFEYNPDGMDKGLTDTEYFDRATQDLVIDSSKEKTLKHHGIKGQKWGIRNAEWYPIADYKAHRERSGEKTVFVSGSSKTQFKDSPYYRKELPSYVKTSLDGYMKNGSKIVVGDAPGLDRQVQDYLNKAKYQNVDVYSPGKEVRYIANPKWNSKLIDDPDHEPYSSEWLAKKDIEMSKVADEGLAVILDEGSNATRNNIRRLEEMGKNVAVYELSKDGPSLDRIVKNYKEVLDMEIKHYTFDPDEYLEHHGVPGQKWGVRNAEWYPIAAWEASQRAAGKAKAAISKAKGALDKTAKKLKRAAAVRKAQKTRIQNIKAQEKAENDAKEQQRVLSRGTIPEILKYTNQVDNRILTNALNDRQTLDRKIAEVTPKKLTRTEKLIKATKSASEIAGNVGKTANDLKNAYDKARPALVALGLVKKKKDFNPLEYGSAKEASKALLKQVATGKIKPSDFDTFNKAINNLANVEKRAGLADSNTDSKTDKKPDKPTEAERREAANKAMMEKAAEVQKDIREGLAAVAAENNSKSNTNSSTNTPKETKDSSSANPSSYRYNVDDRLDYEIRTNNVMKKKLSDYSESWYEDLWD